MRTPKYILSPSASPVMVRSLTMSPFLTPVTQNHGSVVAANILALVSSPNPSSASLKTYKPGGNLIMVSVGPWGGAGQIFGWVPGVSRALPGSHRPSKADIHSSKAWISALVKSRSLFVGDFEKLYNAT